MLARKSYGGCESYASCFVGLSDRSRRIFQDGVILLDSDKKDKLPYRVSYLKRLTVIVACRIAQIEARGYFQCDKSSFVRSCVTVPTR